MKVAGIVAEYNPFHTGHAYQIAQTRAALGEDCAVAAVMSGNWVQQADCAIADKWTRARLALMGGADLVLELPTVWAASSAESFGRGAVELFAASGVVDVLSFGSECGDADKLAQVARCLDGADYQARLRLELEKGVSFPTARQKAVEDVLGPELGGLLAKPNNNLGVEYIRALNALNSSIRPMTVLRRGAAHNSVSGVILRQGDGTCCAGPDSMDLFRFISATQIRMELQEGRWDAAEPYLPAGGRQVLEGSMIDLPSMERVARAMLARVRSMTAEDWAKLPDSGEAEGLPQRLERAGKKCVSMADFFERAKTKRYTRARLTRLVLWAWLGLTEADRPAHPPYLRVLGFNARGQAVLKEMKERSALPIITKPARARELDGAGRLLFEKEASCTDMYDLCLETVPRPGREWTTGPVILL